MSALIERRPPPSYWEDWLERTRDESKPEPESERHISDRSLDCLAAYAREAHGPTAAASLGISESTFKSHLSLAFASLGVTNSIEAFKALGWLYVPPKETDHE